VEFSDFLERAMGVFGYVVLVFGHLGCSLQVVIGPVASAVEHFSIYQGRGFAAREQA
jgi:hypothetical protein